MLFGGTDDPKIRCPVDRWESKPPTLGSVNYSQSTIIRLKERTLHGETADSCSLVGLDPIMTHPFPVPTVRTSNTNQTVSVPGPSVSDCTGSNGADRTDSAGRSEGPAVDVFELLQ